MQDGFSQKLLERDPLPAHEQRPPRLKGRREHRKTGESIPPAHALNLECDHRTAGFDDEIDLAVALAPVEELAVAVGSCIRKMGANRGLDQSSVTPRPTPSCRQRAEG